MSTHNICFCREIRKILCGYPLLSVAMVFSVHMKKLCILGYSKCTEQRFRSDRMNMQADLNLHWVHVRSMFSNVMAQIFLPENKVCHFMQDNLQMSNLIF